MAKGGLGLGLNLGRKKQAAFQQAATTGTLDPWLGKHKRLGTRIENIQANRPGSQQAQRLTSFMAGPTAGQTPWKASGAGATPPPPAPAPTTPATPTVPPPPGAQPSLQDIAKKYQIDMPEELMTAGKGAIESWQESKDWKNGAYEEQFKPSYATERRAG